MSDFTKQIEDVNDVFPVKGIQFGIFDPEMIRRGSVVHVTVPEAFDGDEPKPNGVFDARMGVIDRGRKCLTCEYGNELCPGHFGHIELALPVFYHHFVDYVVDVLRSVCFRCSRLLIDKSDPIIVENLMKLTPAKRSKYMKNLAAKISKCRHDNCSVMKPKIWKLANKTGKRDASSIINIMAEFSSEAITDQNIDRESSISPLLCYRIMKGISDQDMVLLGFSPRYARPEWMICSVVPVLPPSARPSVRNGNQQMADDLTHFYINIVKTNTALKEKLVENNKAQIAGQHALLQYHFSTMQNNDKSVGPLSTHRSNRPLKGISQRFKEKTGRMRGNLQGKRLNYTARSVASVGVDIGIDEFGVPQVICKTLTFPEIVTKKNMDHLYNLVRNGPNRYPGAKAVRKYTTNCFGERVPCTIMLEYVDVMKIKLEVGDVVMRHTMNGDYAVFNRQPSLHRMSMMGHRVVATPNKTFRLNVYATSPYNADFDGDELNMHATQSLQTAQEIKRIAAVEQQIISPAKCKPIITVVQDSISGAYLLSADDTLVSLGDIMNLMINNGNFDGVLPEPVKVIGEVPYWSGHQVYSLVLPDITIDIKNSQKQVVNVVEGKIKSGRIDNSVLKQIVQPIYNIFNPEVTKNFFNDTQNLLTRWMMDSGYSIGFGDVLPSRQLMEQIDQIIDEKMGTVYDKIRMTQQGLFHPDVSPKIQQDTFEAEMVGMLGDIGNTVSGLVKDSFKPDNVFCQSVVSGSKGTWKNSEQVLGLVGQQSIWGARIQNGFTDRTIPHFAKFDNSPYAKGFCRNSFMKGLSPAELFFHAMGGRVGIVDTAIKSVTGDTPLLIIENGVSKRVLIGEWIDNLMTKTAPRIENCSGDVKDINMDIEITDIDKVKILTCDERGNVTWADVTSVTRHDPTDSIYKIETLSGRSVTVAESRSLIVWNGETFEPTYTPDVKLGDYVPVTQEFPNPTESCAYVDMETYLPKSEFLYGTDFKIAQGKIKENIVTARTPRGWWKRNNGVEFTLPYNHAHRVMRAEKRSKIENIQEGHIYPFTRLSGTGIKDTFELNRTNGIFIGLFLAEGNSYKGYIGITNNDNEIIEFVKNWFNERNINWIFEQKVNSWSGQSTTIRGYSVVLSEFFDRFVGKGAENKYVPSEAFNAPIEFRKGVLNGYFSGDGCVTKNSIQVGSASEKLIEGISSLCMSMGIFGKLSSTQLKANNFGTKNILRTYVLSIRAQWAQIFADEIKLIMSDKYQKLMDIKPTKSHRNYKCENDVVLDKIVKITKMDKGMIRDTGYEKMYDITVPSTFNFSLANGLVVRDTAVSGYITRRLIKSLEDVSVKYDMTVRNANNKIVSLTYGDDSFDPTKLEADKIKMILYDDKQMKEKYLFDSYEKKDMGRVLTKSALKSLMAHKDYKQILNSEFEQLMEYRHQLRYEYFPNRKMNDAITIYTPYRVHRLTRHVMGQFELSGNQLSDIDPIYVIESVDALCQDIVKYMRETENSHVLLRMQLKSYLSAKMCIVKHRITKDCFDFLLQTIKDKILKAFVAPGEMVGPIAAQSVGEPSTQLSTEKSTQIALKLENGSYDPEIYIGPIGNIIDDLLENHCDDITDLGNDSVVSLPRFPIYVSTVDCDDETTSWQPICEISRHPANGGMAKITTKSGRVCTTTLTHSHLQRTAEGKIIPKVAADLRVGDRIPVCRKLNYDVEYTTYHDEELDFEYELDELNGWFIGAYLAEGSVNRTLITITNISEYYEKRINEFAEQHNANVRVVDKVGKILPDYPEYHGRDHILSGIANLTRFIVKHCNRGSANKTIPGFALFAPEEFIRGLLRGYFDGDGNINAERQMIRVHSISKRLIEGISLLLNRFGIFGTFTIEKKRRANPLNVLLILKKDARKFMECVGSDFKSKQEGLEAIVAYNEREGAKTRHEYIDMIPCDGIAEAIASAAYPLKLPGYSRNYKRWLKKKSIGRETLRGYCKLFRKVAKEKDLLEDIIDDLEIMEQAVYNDIIWDEIKEIKILDDPKEYVYDLGVTGNHTFMLFNGIYVHNTLNTFHFSGVGSKSIAVTEGAPRIEEIITISKSMKTPSATIYLKDGYKFDKEKAEKLRAALEFTQLKDLVTETEIIYQSDDNPVAQEEDIQFVLLTDQFNQILGIDQGKDYSPLVLRLKFDREALLSRNMTMNEIQESIMKIGAMEDYIQSYTSDDNSSDLVMRLRIIKDDDEGDSEIDFIEDLKKVLLDVTLRGINGIKNVSRAKVGTVVYHPDGSAERVEEQTLNTNGTNLMDILTFDIVDVERTTSNNIHEILEIFGIEAVREKLIEELDTVLESSNINSRHISLLADNMTYSGNLMALSRYGIPNRSLDSGPIAKASNEEITDTLIKAARFHEQDNMKGTSANVMLGQFVPGGTDAFDLMFDETAFLQNYIADYGEGDIAVEVEGDPTKINEMIDTIYDKFDETYDIDDGDFEFAEPITVDEFSLGGQLDLDTDIKIGNRKVKQI